MLQVFKKLSWFKTRKISLVPLIMMTSFFILATGNLTFGETLVSIYPMQDHLVFIVLAWAIVYCAITAFMAICIIFLPVYFVLPFFLIVASVCGYFADTYGVIIDVIMIQNSLETNFAETSNLLTVKYQGRIFILGVVPAILLLLPRVRKTSIVRRTVSLVLFIIGLSLTMITLMFTSSEQFASFFREHRTVRFFVNPVYPIYSLGRYIELEFLSQSAKFNKANLKVERQASDESHDLVIMIVGETARSDHFALNNYKRDTNPLLSKIPNIVSFSNVSSCGTSTAISVPCLFSLSPRKTFDQAQAKRSENILDLAKNAGVSVLWRDNNSDSKGVADRLPYESYMTDQVNTKCDHGECRDIGMLDGLQDYLNEQTSDVLIVLHQMGSHGPAYYLRYPPEFDHFKPSCHTLELADCSQDQIINAYDNTLRYTDYFLSEVIKLLENNIDKYEPMMLYVSDHGESLGENGVYLHGLPYLIAPEAQTKVPVLVWAASTSDVDINATRKLKDEAFSHDSIVSTIATLFELNIVGKGKSTNREFVVLKPELE